MPDPCFAPFRRDAVVIGGCGRTGLPLAVTLASRGARVAALDASAVAAAAVSAAVPPFTEPGLAAPLEQAVAAGRLSAGTDPAVVAEAEHVIVAMGSPGGEPPGLGPHTLARALSHCSGYFRDGQLLILYGTVAPGATARAEKLAADLGVDMDVAYCPERTARGRALSDLSELPQIVASRSARGWRRAAGLLAGVAPGLMTLSPEEAELAKLFSNAWRYITFAAANEMYAMANDRGLDFERIRSTLVHAFPAAAGLPPAGLAAGPCLLKDTLGLVEASAAGALGQAAIEVNEGLPGYLVRRLEQRYQLGPLTVGVLGMAFKGGCDEIRGSLGYRLRQLLADRARRVLCTDPLAWSDVSLVPLETVLAAADLLIIAAPHPQYRGLVTGKPVVDIWNVLGRGVTA